MASPELARRFKPGDTVPAPAGGIGGEVVALRDLGPERQQLFFRDGKGGLASMTVKLDGGLAYVLSEPVEARDARTLALLVLSGRPPRGSVTALVNTLAQAVADLTEPNRKGDDS